MKYLIACFFALFTSASAQVLQNDGNPATYTEISVSEMQPDGSILTHQEVKVWFPEWRPFYMVGAVTVLGRVEIKFLSNGLIEITFDNQGISGTFRLERTSNILLVFQPFTSGQIKGLRFDGTRMIYTIDPNKNFPDGRGFIKMAKTS